MTKLKNSNDDATQKHKLWQNSKTPIGTTQKLKLRQHSVVTVVTELKNSNCDNTQKLKLGQKSNCDKTQKN